MVWDFKILGGLFFATKRGGTTVTFGVFNKMEVYCKNLEGNRINPCQTCVKITAEPFSHFETSPNLQAQAPIVEKKASEPIITVRLANPETKLSCYKHHGWHSYY